MTGYTLEPPYLGDRLAATRDSGSAIRAGIYTGVVARDVELGPYIVDALQLINPDLLGNRTGIYMHNGTALGDTTGCILVGWNPSLSDGARQGILDLITGAAETAMDAQVFNVMINFAGLLSMADFPEITVNIKWGGWLAFNQQFLTWQAQSGLLNALFGNAQ